MMRTLGTVMTLVLIQGCSSSGVETADPAIRLDELEALLLSAKSVEVEFHITAEGAITADMRGTLIVEGEQLELSARGQFMTEPLSIELSTVGEELRGGRETDGVLGPRPPALREGILLGLTRMGLLHNVAVLAGGNPPDGTDGGVRDWVQVVDAQSRSGGALHFGIIVGGEPAGSADLQLEGGLPAVRQQVVQFPGGEMRVVERYYRFIAR